MAGSHRRALPARRFPRTAAIAAPVAVVATGLAVSAGMALSGPVPTDVVASTGHTRAPGVSRDERRAPVLPATTLSPLPTHDAWSTADLNLYAKAGDDASPSGELAEGKKVSTTDVTKNGRVQVLVGGVARWVTGSYLSTQKPLAVSAGLSDAPCPDSSVEKGLQPDTILLYRSVCHAFPQVKDYIGWAPREEHDTGHAIDVMVYGDRALGDAIAAWAQQHASELNLYDVLWYQRIWTPVRASEGWRGMPDRGSETANHMNHVHLGTN